MNKFSSRIFVSKQVTQGGGEEEEEEEEVTFISHFTDLGVIIWFFLQLICCLIAAVGYIIS